MGLTAPTTNGPAPATGHEALLSDLDELIGEARDYQFDDFKNTKYVTPKVELRNKFLLLAQNVVEGRYD